MRISSESVSGKAPASSGDLVLRQLRGLPPASDVAGIERRVRAERRRLTVWSVLYGGFRPRRRYARRVAETTLPVVDWHESHLLGVSVAILLLCLMDACLTVIFILGGGSELNPIMSKLISVDVALFAVAKIALTGFGILVLVFLSKLRMFGRVPVGRALYAVLVIYSLLVAYELTILSSYFI